MAKAPGHISVYCYHCGRRVEVGGRTMSTACPSCGKAVITQDIVVKSYKPVTSVETCGRLIVHKSGRVMAQKRVVAHGGIRLEGALQSPITLTAGHVSLGEKSQWKGDLVAASLSVEPGAQILEGKFSFPCDPLAEFRDQPETPARRPARKKREAHA